MTEDTPTTPVVTPVAKKTATKKESKAPKDFAWALTQMKDGEIVQQGDTTYKLSPEGFSSLNATRGKERNVSFTTAQLLSTGWSIYTPPKVDKKK